MAVIKQPKNLEYRTEYNPDMARMVKALRVLLDYECDSGKENEHDYETRKKRIPYSA